VASAGLYEGYWAHKMSVPPIPEGFCQNKWRKKTEGELANPCDCLSGK